MGAGYGLEVVLDHGHDLLTCMDIFPPLRSLRGSMFFATVIGYVAIGTCTGPHLHYEVRVHDAGESAQVPRMTYEEARTSMAARLLRRANKTFQ